MADHAAPDATLELAGCLAQAQAFETSLAAAQSRAPSGQRYRFHSAIRQAHELAQLLDLELATATADGRQRR